MPIRTVDSYLKELDRYALPGGMLVVCVKWKMQDGK